MSQHIITMHLRKGSQGISLGIAEEVFLTGQAHHILWPVVWVRRCSSCTFVNYRRYKNYEFTEFTKDAR